MNGIQNKKYGIQNPNFLIVNPFGIGDVLFTFPLIEAIKKNSPQAIVDYVCNIRTEPIVFANPNIDKAFIYEKDQYRELWKKSKIACLGEIFNLFKDIRRNKYDMVFDLSLAQEYGLFLWLAKTRERIGYNYKNRGIFLTRKIDIPGYFDKHIVDYYLGLLPLAGMKIPDALRMNIYLTDEAVEKADRLLTAKGISKNERFVCIAPGAGASWGSTSFKKHWPRENFAELAKGLLSQCSKVKVLLIGGPEEKSICDYIKGNAGHCINICGETDLLTSAAVIKRAKLLIANDGGPLHMAVATGTRTVSIFGPVDDKVYGPYHGNGKHVVVKNNSLNCRPCYRNFKMPECEGRRCLTDINVISVLRAAEDAMLRA